MKKLITLLFIAIVFCIELSAQDLVISNVTIVDVEKGRLIKSQDVFIKGDRIIGVKPATNGDTKKLNEITTIDGRGKYVVPGLWDMHVHFGGGDSLIQENKDLLSLYILYGITSVRDAAADLSSSVIMWKEEIVKGIMQGPSIYTSGPKLEGYKSIWVGDLEISNSRELQQALDSLTKLRVDFVKITDNTLTPELYIEALQQSVKRGWKTSGHVPGAISLQQISKAGLSSVEHISYMLKAGSSKDEFFAAEIKAGRHTAKEVNLQIMSQFDTVHAMKVFKMLAKNNTAVVPTLSIIGTTAYLDRDDHRNDSMLKYIGPGLRNTYSWRVERAAKDSPDAVAYRHRVFETAAGLLPMIQRSGIKIIAGTDAGYLNCFVYPGLGLHKELEAMVKYGMTPLDALRASVINGPEFMGRSVDYGAIKSGRKADILLLDADPMVNISNTQKIHAVILKGKYYGPEELAALRHDIKLKATSGRKFEQ